MQIAIHNSPEGFHPGWINYCKVNQVKYKLVNCYDNDIIDQLFDCNALMWHHGHSDPKDILIARHILMALDHSGFVVFPNIKTTWHFDDKVAQKYLFEALGVPHVKSYTFVEKDKALSWAQQTTYPKVFKLRGGAGSSNVILIRNHKEAKKVINKSFSVGFKQFNAFERLKERYNSFRLGKAAFTDVVKGIIRLVYEPKFSKIAGRSRGYTYFQDFLPHNDSDTRIVVIDKKAYGLKRMVRKNDFRASGSGITKYARDEFDERCLKIAFELTEKLDAQCVAYDFIFNEQQEPQIVEISYGFMKGYKQSPGYWSNDLKWHEEKFNPEEWMVELVIKQASKRISPKVRKT